MKLLALKKKDQNEALIDPWTLVHLSAGLACGLVETPLRHALFTSIAYELGEQQIERRSFGNRFFRSTGPESLANAVVDVGVFAVGHWLGRRWNET